MKTTIRVFQWLPRAICILAILLISLLAADAFAPGLTIWQQLGGFLIHLIPSFILLAILIVAWKWEFIGGILIVTFPFVVAGILFIISHFMNKKNLLKTHNQ